MLILAVFLALFNLTLPSSQEGKELIRYTNDKHDYSIDIEKSAILQRQELEKGYSDIFIVKSQELGLKYVVTISKLEKGETDEASLHGQEYKDGFLTSCNCDVLEYYKNDFNEYKGVIYKINQIHNDQTFKGIVANMIKDESIYIVSLYTIVDQFPHYEQDFKNIMNTIQLM